MFCLASLKPQFNLLVIVVTVALLKEIKIRICSLLNQRQFHCNLDIINLLIWFSSWTNFAAIMGDKTFFKFVKILFLRFSCFS